MNIRVWLTDGSFQTFFDEDGPQGRSPFAPRNGSERIPGIVRHDTIEHADGHLSVVRHEYSGLEYPGGFDELIELERGVVAFFEPGDWLRAQPV